MRWASERQRVDNIAISCQQQAADGGGQAWRQLAGAVSSLAGSLDTALRLRAEPGSDPDLVRDAIALVSQRRGEMMRDAQLAAQTS